MDEVVIDERLEFVRILNRDAYALFRIRYTRINELDDEGVRLSSAYHSYYGGFEDRWREFEPFAELDFDFDGVICLDGNFGRDLMRGVEGINREREMDRASIIKLRDTLDQWIAGTR